MDASNFEKTRGVQAMILKIVMATDFFPWPAFGNQETIPVRTEAREIFKSPALSQRTRKPESDH